MLIFNYWVKYVFVPQILVKFEISLFLKLLTILVLQL